MIKNIFIFIYLFIQMGFYQCKCEIHHSVPPIYNGPTEDNNNIGSFGQYHHPSIIFVPTCEKCPIPIKQQQCNCPVCPKTLDDYKAKSPSEISVSTKAKSQSNYYNHQQFIQQPPSMIDEQKSHQYEVNENKNDYSHKKENVFYKFAYNVNDHKTGDIKKHEEERKGDVVTGEYSLVEHDGNIRTVKYYADWKSGFHAQVHNSKKKPLG